jgi:hypothetical protein
VGDERFYVKGVSYGAFTPREDDTEYHAPETIEGDFAQMAAMGSTLSAFRTPYPHFRCLTPRTGTGCV